LQGETDANPTQDVDPSAQVAGLLATAGLLPQAAQAAWSQAAFDAKTLADAVKALGGGAPAESKDVSHHRPGHRRKRRRGAVGCSTTLAGVKMLACWSRRTPARWRRCSR
jgi:sulfur-oxidizing protein SoxY